MHSCSDYRKLRFSKELSILYLRCWPTRRLNTCHLWCQTLSILYLRCANNTRRGDSGAGGILSILYLRCPHITSDKGLASLQTFQFSI